MENDLYGYAAAAAAGRIAQRDGQGRHANPYLTWTPRGGLSTGVLGSFWQSGWNRAAGLNSNDLMTVAETEQAACRCKADRDEYEAERDPAAKARTLSRSAAKARAGDRRRIERAAVLCDDGFTLIGGPYGDIRVPVGNVTVDDRGVRVLARSPE